MGRSKIEQRIHLKGLVKLNKTATESFRMLSERYGEECMSRAGVYQWHRKFCEGREDVKEDGRCGRPCTSRTAQNVKRIKQIVRNDPRLSIRMIAEMVSIDKETVRQILHKNLNMTKVCAKVVPKVLTPDQKENRRRICADILGQIEANPRFLESVVTCGKTWIFQYNPERKWQSLRWKASSSPRMKKVRRRKSKFKAMLIVFFDIKGVIMEKWISTGARRNQQYYTQLLETLHGRITRRRPLLWENGFILHQDNTPGHTALSVKQFLAEKRIAVLDHPPYSPDLAPCDFFLFPKIKSALKGGRFRSVLEVKKKTTEILRKLTKDDLLRCFNQWKTRMQRCVAAKGEYIGMPGPSTTNAAVPTNMADQTVFHPSRSHEHYCQSGSIQWTEGAWQNAGNISGKKGPSLPIQTSLRWQWLGMDVKGRLPRTHDGHTHMLTVMDFYTKWVEAYPMKSLAPSEVALNIHGLVCQLGRPRRILSRMNAAFLREVNLALSAYLAEEACSLVVFHPEACTLDLLTHSYVDSMVCELLVEHQRSWDVQLPASLFSLRCREHPSTRYSPFYMLYGREPCTDAGARELPILEDPLHKEDLAPPPESAALGPGSKPSSTQTAEPTSHVDLSDVEEVLVVQCERCSQWDWIPRVSKARTSREDSVYACTACRDVTRPGKAARP